MYKLSNELSQVTLAYIGSIFLKREKKERHIFLFQLERYPSG